MGNNRFYVKSLLDPAIFRGVNEVLTLTWFAVEIIFLTCYGLMSTFKIGLA